MNGQLFLAKKMNTSHVLNFAALTDICCCSEQSHFYFEKFTNKWAVKIKQ